MPYLWLDLNGHAARGACSEIRQQSRQRAPAVQQSSSPARCELQVTEMCDSWLKRRPLGRWGLVTDTGTGGLQGRQGKHKVIRLGDIHVCLMIRKWMSAGLVL